MIRLTAVIFAIFISLLLVAISLSQPIPLTQWERISTSPADPSEPPRIATFSDGGYVVVYTLLSMNNVAVGSIFGPDGAILESEFELPDTTVPCASPRVIVFSDDSFMTAWNDLNTNEIRAKLWYNNGTAATNQFKVSFNSVAPSAVSNFFEIALMPNDSWCIAYPGDSYVNVQWFENKGSWTNNFQNFVASTAHLGLTVNFAENKIYLFIEGMQPNVLPIYRISVDLGFSNVVTRFDDPTPMRPFAVSMSSGFVAALWQSEFDGGSTPSSIGVSLIQPGFVTYPNYTVVNDNTQSDGAYNPMAIDLGNDRLLVAYEGTFLNVTRPIYRMLYVSPTSPLTRTSPLGPEVFEDEAIRNIYMAATVQSNIVVVANNISGSDIVRRVLTFCGNGALDLNEQCDGTESCSQTCRCERGTISVNGLCNPECGDGLVIGSEQCDSSEDSSCDNTNCVCAAGFIPTVPRANACVRTPSSYIPSVGPTLDCIAPDEVPVAHFSFLNEDGFPQNIPRGDLNRFIPDTLGSDRPIQFESGASLTFPVAPYTLQLPSDIQSFTWLLGQFNLTIDLTNISALFCPRDVSFIARMLTSDILTEDLVQVFLNNFARRYGVAEWRLTAVVVLNNPAEKRSVQQSVSYYDYSVTVTVAAANTTGELSSEQVISDFFTEYKNETRQREITEDLTQGLEPVNPQIKEVTPAPTGVSVRSNKYDAASPVTQPVTVAQPVSQPVKISSGTKIFYSVLFGLMMALAM